MTSVSCRFYNNRASRHDPQHNLMDHHHHPNISKSRHHHLHHTATSFNPSFPFTPTYHMYAQAEAVLPPLWSSGLLLCSMRGDHLLASQAPGALSFSSWYGAASAIQFMVRQQPSTSSFSDAGLIPRVRLCVFTLAYHHHCSISLNPTFIISTPPSATPSSEGFFSFDTHLVEL